MHRCYRPHDVRGCFVVLFALLFCAACSNQGKATGTTPSGPVSELPTPATNNVQDAVKETFQREFGEAISRPAIFNDPRSANCLGEGHLTSTAYFPTGTRSRLLFVYTSRDGTQLIRKETVASAITPAGRFRVLVVLSSYAETFSEADLPAWQAAQEQINASHAAFAAARGFGAPIVSFDSTNVVLPGGAVQTPNSLNSVVAALAARGVSTTGYRFIIAINLDPAKSEGGSAFVGATEPAFIYVGNYSRWQRRLTAAEFNAVASTAYRHEVSHHWGWPGTHDWSPSCSSGINFEPGIAAPILFGWEDTDGDGVPEILDTTPYGRP